MQLDRSDVTRLAFLADIHGNLPALQAVILDLHTQSPDAVYLVGDQINRCPWSNEVFDLISDLGWPSIYGNHELVLRKLSGSHEPYVFDDRRRFPDLWWTLQRLGSRRLEALTKLPSDLSLDAGGGPPIRLVHGVPGNPFRGVFLHSDAQHIDGAFAGVDEPLVVCAHTHQPLHRSMERRLILNGGSVGIPYNGDPPRAVLGLDVHGRRLDASFPAGGVSCGVRAQGVRAPGPVQGVRPACRHLSPDCGNGAALGERLRSLVERTTPKPA